MHIFSKFQRITVATLCCGVAAAQAAVVTEANFISNSVIDFEAGPAYGFSYGATYAAQGVADVNLCNDGIYDTGSGPPSTTAGSLISPNCTAPLGGGSISFAGPVVRVGFDISSHDAADALCLCHRQPALRRPRLGTGAGLAGACRAGAAGAGAPEVPRLSAGAPSSPTGRCRCTTAEAADAWQQGPHRGTL